MAWIESHQELERHPKTLKLKNLMEWDIDQTIGRLHRFWWWCVDYARDGQLDKFNNEQLASAIGLNPEDGNKFINSMIESGFIDKEPRFQIHEWNKYFGMFLRRSHPEIYETVRKLYGNHAENVPYLTKPNLTKPITTAASAKPGFGNKGYEVKTSLQQVVVGWKIVTGVPPDDREWDKLNWARTSKTAKELLGFFGDSPSTIVDCMEDVYNELSKKGLECTIETVKKRAWEWRKKNDSKTGNKTAA